MVLSEANSWTENTTLNERRAAIANFLRSIDVDPLIYLGKTVTYKEAMEIYSLNAKQVEDGVKNNFLIPMYEYQKDQLLFCALDMVGFYHHLRVCPSP